MHGEAPGRNIAVPAFLAGMVSVQIGASLAKSLFPIAGPQGTVALRVSIAAVLLAALCRPWRGRLDRATLIAILIYGLPLGVMNLSFYLALARLDLGPTVAIEFLGPLCVAIAGSRRLRDLALVAVAVAGVVCLLGPDAAARQPDPVGVAYALVAALAWALYIVAGRRLAVRLPAARAAALGHVVACLVVLPFGLRLAAPILARWDLLAIAAMVALLSSAIPYTLEMLALRRMRAGLFGMMMSIEPVIAALAGLVLLGEHPGPLRLAGIAAIVLASAASVLLAARPAATVLLPP